VVEEKTAAEESRGRGKKTVAVKKRQRIEENTVRERHGSEKAAEEKKCRVAHDQWFKLSPCILASRLFSIVIKFKCRQFLYTADK
jgi:hypothetical protein